MLMLNIAMQEIWSISVNPTNPQHILLFAVNGNPRRSTNGGASWSATLDVTRTATDIPWLGWTNEGWMANGNTVFDPVVPNLIWFVEVITLHISKHTVHSTLIQTHHTHIPWLVWTNEGWISNDNAMFDLMMRTSVTACTLQMKCI